MLASSDAGKKKVKVAKKNIPRAKVPGSSLKVEFFRPVILQILARLNIDIDRTGKRDLLLKFTFLYRVTTNFRQENLVRFVLIYF
jgi:hypothetical protein